MHCLSKLLFVAAAILFLVPTSTLSYSSFALQSGNDQSGLQIIERIVTCPPGGYVSTPDGCVPRHCAFASVQYANANTGVVDFSNGTKSEMPADCMRGTPLISTVSVLSNGTNDTITGSTLNPLDTHSNKTPTTNGWVENTQFSNCVFGVCQELSSFSGYWIVPTAPSNVAGQTIFLFIGEEDYWMTEIIQPVLQWGSACDGGGNYWSIASWLVWGSSCSQSTHTGPYTVKAGDVIYGSMQDVGGGNWKIFVEDTSCGSSCYESETVGANTMYNAYVTLEAYNVNSCNQYPASGSTYFYSMYISGGTPGWVYAFPFKDCGRSDHITSSGG